VKSLLNEGSNLKTPEDNGLVKQLEEQTAGDSNPKAPLGGTSADSISARMEGFKKNKIRPSQEEEKVVGEESP